ncbi:MAG: hypothetical protein AMXMBFR84_34770 [Candidatus Hydrogenedentota bacterium]
MSKKQHIEEEIEYIDRRLANAESYLAQGVNIEGQDALFHLDDWSGNSGHPLWMKNHMIPVTERYKARKLKALESIDAKDKAKRIALRKKSCNDFSPK